MKTEHKLIYADSRRMSAIPDRCVDLIVTSPPYPMVEMWDGLFAGLNPQIGRALENGDGPGAFEAMHRQLDEVWQEAFRVLKPGAIACINVGDATRTIDGRFSLYPNHARILQSAQKLGFCPLPAVLWRKQTNAPNKFMGSGMIPPCAYVTLEHEYILILRKGDKRKFTSDREKQLRRKSAFFWEERNHWFSDVWFDLKGTVQSLFDANARKRSAAFPFELPYRLVSMFSVKQDLVLDPFLGIGTTAYAAMAAARNSIGCEIDHNLDETIQSKLSGIVEHANKRISQRLASHLEFVEKRYRTHGKFKHANHPYRFPVVTRQETALLVNELQSVRRVDENTFEAFHSDEPQSDYVASWAGYFADDQCAKSPPN